jgi:hypothetical protein
MRLEVKEAARATGVRTALENAWLCGDRPYTKAKAGCWTRWRAFAQVRRGSNIQLLPFPLVTLPSMVMRDLKTTPSTWQRFKSSGPPNRLSPAETLVVRLRIRADLDTSRSG